MSCPRCRSESTLKRGYRTSLGSRIYHCRFQVLLRTSKPDAKLPLNRFHL